MSAPSTLLPFQPATMSTAQLAAVSYLARYSGRTHVLYAFQLREWFAWCESNRLDPLVGIQRAHVERYIRGLGVRGLMDPSVNTMMHAVRGYFRFAHIDGLIPADPGVYARLPKVHRDESRTQGLDRLALTLGELEVLELVQQGAVLIDTRVSGSSNGVTLPGARSLPHDQAVQRRGELDPSRVSILFCNGPQCPQSPLAIRALLEAGRSANSLAYYRGGVHDWVTLAMPTEATS